MERPLQRILASAGQRLQPFGLVEHDLRLADEGAAVDGRRGSAPAALEKLHPELVLELRDLGAQGRLADMAARGGAAKLTLAGKADGIFQVAEVHRRSL